MKGSVKMSIKRIHVVDEVINYLEANIISGFWTHGQKLAVAPNDPPFDLNGIEDSLFTAAR